MNPTRKLNTEQVKEIYKKFEAGISQKAVAKQYNLKELTIFNVFHGKTFKYLHHLFTDYHSPKKVTRRKLNAEQVKEIYKLFEAGISQKAVAKQYNVKSTTIFNVFHGKTFKYLHHLFTNYEKKKRLSKKQLWESIEAFKKSHPDLFDVELKAKLKKLILQRRQSIYQAKYNARLKNKLIPTSMKIEDTQERN